MAEEQDLLDEDRAGGWDVVLLYCSVHVYDKVRGEVRHRARRARTTRQEAEVGNLLRTSYAGNPLPVHCVHDALRYPLPLLRREGSELSDGTERNHRGYLGFEKEPNVLLDTLQVELE